MKREILFKAKRLDGQGWVFGSFVYTENNSTAILDCSYGTRKEYRVIVGTVCQFTGLIDKNGNKIFEGDIINCLDYDNDEPYKTTVRFEDGGFLVDVRGFDYDITCIGFMDDDTELEIIGNIHD